MRGDLGGSLIGEEDRPHPILPLIGEGYRKSSGSEENVVIN